MARLDAYLRSIEKFGAAGAVMISGQAVTLKFPGGDRNATQVTPHEILVGMVRELAPPAALDTIDQSRPARFEIESEGRRYQITVSPRPNMWQVAIEPAVAAPAPAPAAPSARVRAKTPPPFDGDMSIERGQYDASSDASPVATTSGSTLLDQLTRAARGARATDVYLASGAPPLQRVGGELVPQSGASPLDADSISREVGIVATPEARAGWTELGVGTFAYGDGAGRVRATLGRDRRGPTAALRLLPEEGPALDRVNLQKATELLGMRGLMFVVGTAAAGKTVALAALVRALGEAQRRVVTIETPIEILHHGISAISQRAVGEHVPSVRAGVDAALSEGTEAIAIASVTTADAASGVFEAVLGGQLVIAVVTAPSASAALERVVSYLDDGARDLARSVLTEAWIGAVKAGVRRDGTRAFEVTHRPTG